jgi:hypothetical protein
MLQPGNNYRFPGCDCFQKTKFSGKTKKLKKSLTINKNNGILYYASDEATGDSKEAKNKMKKVVDKAGKT